MSPPVEQKGQIRVCARKNCQNEFRPKSYRHVCCSRNCNSALQQEKFRKRDPLGYAAKKQRWQAKNSARISAMRTARRKSDPEYNERKNEISRRSSIKYRYGVSFGEKQRLIAIQGGQCGNPACTTVYPGYHGWHLDHDHETKRIRGVLCRACNLAIGHAKESADVIAGLIQYLNGKGRQGEQMGATSEHFSAMELECHGTKCGPNCAGTDKNGCQQAIVDALEQFRAAVSAHQGKDTGIVVNDAFRCAIHNAEVGGVANSEHVQGIAADVTVWGMTGAQLEAIALTCPSITAIGRSDNPAYIHIDTRHMTQGHARWCYDAHGKWCAWFPAPSSEVNA